MKTLFTSFAVLCALFSSVHAAAETTIQEDYIWQERFNERLAAAQSGDAEAQFNIGEMFEKGSGVPIDLKRAFVWFERAAKQKHQKARFKLAYMYYRGEGTTSNPGKAFKLMESLAKGGYVRAQYYLGMMYETGVVTARDLSQAYTWYRRAAAGGYTPATEALADLAKLAPDLVPETASLEFESDTPPSVPVKPAPAIAAPAPIATKPSFAAVKPPPSTTSPPVTALLGETARGVQAAPAAEISVAPPITDSAMATIASVQSAIQAPPSTYALLANGNWMMSQSNLPVEFLPSKVTRCERSSTTTLDCLSSDIVSNIANVEIVYQTRATVSAVQNSAEFKVTYRNNVIKILRDLDPGNPDDPSQTGMGIGLGWQETEHHLECKLENGQTVHCVKNQTQKLTIKNQMAL